MPRILTNFVHLLYGVFAAKNTLCAKQDTVNLFLCVHFVANQNYTLKMSRPIYLHTFCLTLFILLSPLRQTMAKDAHVFPPLQNLREGSMILAKKYANNHTKKTNDKADKVRKVVIDAGHGGHDSGCHSAAGTEKTNTLAIALLIGEKIKATFADVQVIYTRSTDVFVPLQERAAIANRAKADLFISIHCNSTDEGNTAQGTETYTLGMHKKEANLNVAKRENASITLEDNYEQKYDGFDPNSTEAYIMFNLIQNAYLARSQKFAELVETTLHDQAKRKSLGVKQAGFMVLKETAMPSVLIETGFLNNPTEGRYISSESGQETIAQAIFDAFGEYKRFIEGNHNESPNVETPSTASTETPAPRPAAKIKPTNTPSVQKVSNPQPTPKITPSAAPVAAAKKTTSRTVYKVQVASSRTPLKNLREGKWKNIAPEIVNANGIYKYWVGEFEDKAAANAELKSLQQMGFKDAFVVSCDLVE